MKQFKNKEDKTLPMGLLSLYDLREDDFIRQEKEANDQVTYVFNKIDEVLPFTTGKGNFTEELQLCKCYLQKFQNYIRVYSKSLSFDYYQQIEKVLHEFKDEVAGKDKKIEELKAEVKNLKSDRQINLF